MENSESPELYSTFSVKYVGYIEVQTSVIGHQAEWMDLANACAKLIGFSANILNNNSVESRLQALIGNCEPKASNRDVELTITDKLVTISCPKTSKLIRKILRADISIAVLVTETVEHGFVFFGKAKVGGVNGEMKRLCFLLQAKEDPASIYNTFQNAFKINRKQGEGNNDPPPLPPNEPPCPAKSTENKWTATSTVNAKKPYSMDMAMKIKEHSRWNREDEIEQAHEETFGSLNRRHDSIGTSYTLIQSQIIGSEICHKPSIQEPCTLPRFYTICDNLPNEPWFFGKIPRRGAEDLLKHDGEFLVRVSESRPLTVILSVRKANQIHHVMLNDANGNVVSDQRYFPSILHLMCYHYRNKMPFTSDDNNPIKVSIVHPVTRPPSSKKGYDIL